MNNELWKSLNKGVIWTEVRYNIDVINVREVKK